MIKIPLITRLVVTSARRVPVMTSRMLHATSSLLQQSRQPVVAADTVAADTVAVADVTNDAQQEEVPWYLREEVGSSTNAEEDIKIPEVQENSPESLTTFLNLVVRDYGLQNVQFYDLTTLDHDHPHSIENQPFDYIIIATGKSEKHVFKAGQELKHFIKHKYSKQARINGLVSASPNPVTRRRMVKRANKSPPATDNNFGMPANSWVMCETLVDNICIHFLTELRREELNLESLWVPEGQGENLLQSSAEFHNKNNKDIPPFFLSRRQFHTTSRKYNPNVIESILNKKELTEDLIKEHIQDYESNFKGDLLSEYNMRNEFYRLLHIVSPSIVPLSQVRDIILEKHSNLKLLSSIEDNLSQEKSKDLIAYMKVLLDSPELSSNFNGKEIADERCNLLSEFVTILYRLSSDDLDLHTIPELIPLLWRLSFIEKSEGIELGSSIVNETITDKDNKWPTITFNTLTNAENRSRDINDLLELYAKSSESILSPSVREIQLYTFGNAGSWSDFWKTWDIINLLTGPQDFKSWLSLTTYLALRKDVEANVYFCKRLFTSSTSVSGSLLSCYESNKSQLSVDDKQHLRQSLSVIFDSVLSSEILPNIDEIKRFINAL